MEYNSNQTIYRQISDYCIKQIISGIWPPGQRIPSTRELSLNLGVNSRTVIRAYEELEALGIIYTQRGFGSFTHADVLERIKLIKEKEFLSSGLDDFIRLAREAGFSMTETVDAVRTQWVNSTN